MAGNNVVWQPQVVDEMLCYYKDKIQSEGKQFIFKETHHQECATQINEKFHTTFTQRQIYHKFHKLKAQWKIILEAKNLSGANFDDVNKIILYDETEVVRMKNTKGQNISTCLLPLMMRWSSYFGINMLLESSRYFKHPMTVFLLVTRISSVIKKTPMLRLIPQHNMILIVSQETTIMKAPLRSVLEVESGTKVRGSSVTIV